VGVQPTLDLLLTGAALCNDAVLEVDEQQPGAYRAVGDPTEGSLVVAAAHLELFKRDLDQAFPRVAEIPFDSVRKRMTTVHQCPQTEVQIPPSLAPVWARKLVQAVPSHLAFTKGAVDSLLDVSGRVWVDSHPEPLDERWHERIMTAHNQLAKNGMRVLGVAFRPLEAAPGIDEE
jgi:Ca2+-transporting ATPase